MIRKLPAYMNDEEFIALLKCVRKRHHKLAYILAYNSGLRVGEVCKLQPENVDMASKRIFIRDAKGGKDRVVPLPKGFPASYLKELPLKCKVRALQTAFKTAMKKAGIQKSSLHFHSLRHSFALRAMERGIPLNQIQVLLGHKNISTTSIYLNINPKDARSCYEEMS